MIYFVSPGSEVSNTMFNELRETRAVCYVDSPFAFSNKTLEKLCMLYAKVSIRVSLPLNWIWYPFYSLTRLPLKKDDVVILGNGDFNYYDYKYLRHIDKRAGGVRYVAYFIDPISGLASRHVLNDIQQTPIDIVFTFDKEDAKREKWYYMGNIYSKVPVSSHGQEHTAVYFCGSNKKNRVDQVNLIHKALTEKGIKCRFRVTGVEQNKQYSTDIVYNKKLSYQTILEQIQECSCILEIVQSDSVGATLRYCEAICYNKKLLTNNPTVRELPYYNPDWIYVFNSIDDIDPEWITMETKVDYQYKGDFSPNNLLKKVNGIITDEQSLQKMGSGNLSTEKAKSVWTGKRAHKAKPGQSGDVGQRV